MEFLPEDEFWRRFGVARRDRVNELVEMGIPRPNAKAQASAEFGMYDLMEIDERGWIRFESLDLPATPPRRATRSSRRGTSAAPARKASKPQPKRSG